MMSRKDYEAIARCVAGAAYGYDDRDHPSVETCCEIAASLATVMAQDNPRFDRERFLKACGVTS